MTTVQLEELANQFNIGGYADQMGHIDRSIIIAELLKRDKSLQLKKPPVQSHTIHVGTMTGSVIQQGTTNSQVSVTLNFAEVKNLVERIREAMSDLPLSDDSKEELRSDIQTIEPQLSSPRPKLPIIETCLHSMRNVLQEAAGHTTAILLANEITKYLAILHH